MDKEIISLIAASLTTGCYLPQVIKVAKTKSTQDLSLLMLILFCFGLVLWFVYGLLIQSLALILGNSITLVLAVIVLIYKLKFK